MPQLDPSTYSSQLFWLFVCCFVLFFSLKQIFFPRIESVFLERKNLKAKSSDESSKFKEDSAKIKDTIDARLKEARSESYKKLSKVKSEIESSMKSEYLRLEENFKIRTKESEDKIDSYKSLASKELEEVTLNASWIAMKKFTGLEIDRSSIQKSISQIKSLE